MMCFSSAEGQPTPVPDVAQRPNVSLIEDAYFPSYEQRQSRGSAVKIAGVDGNSHGSGTYIKINGSYAVITARHVVDGADIFRVGSETETVIGQVIWKSQQYDIAVLKIPEMITRSHITLTKQNPLQIGEPVLYTGYPASYKLLTSRGYVSGHEPGYRATLLQGFVWFGYSGSGVFDAEGRLRAIVVAIGVQNFAGGVEPLESLVYVHEITKEQLKEIKKAFSN
jgi:S1-C subfamily serine protease